MAGAGGTEAQDWAEMLQRMYVRFFQRRGMKHRIVAQEVSNAKHTPPGRRETWQRLQALPTVAERRVASFFCGLSRVHRGRERVAVDDFPTCKGKFRDVASIYAPRRDDASHALVEDKSRARV